MSILTSINGHTHIKQMAQNIINGVSYPNQNTTHLDIKKSEQNENPCEHINLPKILKNIYNTTQENGVISNPKNYIESPHLRIYITFKSPKWKPHPH